MYTLVNIIYFNQFLSSLSPNCLDLIKNKQVDYIVKVETN